MLYLKSTKWSFSLFGYHLKAISYNFFIEPNIWNVKNVIWCFLTMTLDVF